MSDLTTSTPESLADYIRTENAKERDAAGLEGDGAPLPEAEVVTSQEAAESEPVTAKIDAPDEKVEAASERNQDGTFKAKVAEKADSVQKRIDKAVKAQREAERKAEAAEARIREFEARTPKTEPAAVAAPSASIPDKSTAKKLPFGIENFVDEADPIAAFTVAANEWLDAQREQARKAEAEKRTFQERNSEIAAEGRDQFPDWDEVMTGEAAQIDIPPYLYLPVHEHPQSAAILHYLGTHPDELRSLVAQPAASALLHLGTVAARLTPASNGSGERSVAHSKAKPLTKPLRGSTPSAPSAPKLDPETTSLADWIRLGNAADRRRERESRGA
jgi:hypothetical protein